MAGCADCQSKCAKRARNEPHPGGAGGSPTHCDRGFVQTMHEILYVPSSATDACWSEWYSLRLYAMHESSSREVFCAGCGTAVTGGARYCHKCGLPVGSPAARARTAARSSSPPLALVFGIVAVVGLLAFLAGRTFSGESDTSRSPLGEGSLLPGQGQAVRAPDISQLSPEESADRLYNRVMLLASQNKTDSVLFFAPMAIEAYRMLGPLNADQRYDVGHIAEVAGVLPFAMAQADTILLDNPAHLLGLVLAARVAAQSNDDAASRSYTTRLRRAYDAESAKKLPEYDRHADDIARALGAVEDGTPRSP